jgi:hypothetical protein
MNKFDKLFQSGEDWESNACLNINRRQHLAYSLGYKEAAEFLAQYVVKLNSQDLLVYPIISLYRHHLELQFKLLIERGNILLDVAGYDQLHDLSKLWSNLKDLIHKIWGLQNSDSLDLIDHIVNEYKVIDPKSMTFRYSVDRDGNNHLAKIKHINSTNFPNTLNEVAITLDGIYQEIEQLLDPKFEFHDLSVSRLN